MANVLVRDYPELLWQPGRDLRRFSASFFSKFLGAKMMEPNKNGHLNALIHSPNINKALAMRWVGAAGDILREWSTAGRADSIGWWHLGFSFPRGRDRKDGIFMGFEWLHQPNLGYIWRFFTDWFYCFFLWFSRTVFFPGSFWVHPQSSCSLGCPNFPPENWVFLATWSYKRVCHTSRMFFLNQLRRWWLPHKLHVDQISAILKFEKYFA